MKQKPLRIALIVLHENDRQSYMQFLNQYSFVEIDLYYTIQHFRKACLEKKYSGIVIDGRTVVTSSTIDRQFINSLSNYFPMIRASSSSISANISFMLFGNNEVHLQGKQLLDHFVKEKCLSTDIRGIRLDIRSKIYFNILLYHDEKSVPLKANLWNISEGGCFIISNVAKKIGDPLWIRIEDFKDRKKIQCTIEWIRPWGDSIEKISGFGTSFTKISKKQLVEIKRYISIKDLK